MFTKAWIDDKMTNLFIFGGRIPTKVPVNLPDVPGVHSSSSSFSSSSELSGGEEVAAGAALRLLMKSGALDFRPDGWGVTER